MGNDKKWSMFNVLFYSNSNYYIHNTLNGGMHEIDKSTFQLCKDIEENRISLSSSIYEKLIQTLTSLHYIVGTTEDQESINKLRYLKLLKTFQQERLSLVIAPTLYCNFACPYCYEKNLPNEQMDDVVIDMLINFIKQRESDFKQLEICWHGGEPLTAIGTIEKILHRIRDEINIKFCGHSIVTNGYLINEKVLECFEKYPLGYIQITIDGNETTHNQNRISKNGKPTFTKIIENIDTLIQRFPKTRIGVRMNIHKNNVDEFIPLYEILSKRWEKGKVSIYPAFVMNNASCKVPCFNSIEKTEFLYEIYKKIGKKYSEIDMKIKTGNCTAIYENSFVIDPKGNIFKCWADVGISKKRIGTLNEGITNYTLVEKYLLSSDKFTDKKCLKCKVFPICSGGCNKYRIDEEFNTDDICPLSVETITKFLQVS